MKKEGCKMKRKPKIVCVTPEIKRDNEINKCWPSCNPDCNPENETCTPTCWPYCNPDCNPERDR